MLYRGLNKNVFFGGGGGRIAAPPCKRLCLHTEYISAVARRRLQYVF